LKKVARFLIVGFFASTVDALTTCMQVFGKVCGVGGCRDFEYSLPDCRMLCLTRQGQEVIVGCYN